MTDNVCVTNHSLMHVTTSFGGLHASHSNTGTSKFQTGTEVGLELFSQRYHSLLCIASAQRAHAPKKSRRQQNSAFSSNFTLITHKTKALAPRQECANLPYASSGLSLPALSAPETAPKPGLPRAACANIKLTRQTPTPCCFQTLLTAHSLSSGAETQDPAHALTDRALAHPAFFVHKPTQCRARPRAPPTFAGRGLSKPCQA